MTIPKIRCKYCGYKGEYNSEVYDECCQECSNKLEADKKASEFDLPYAEAEARNLVKK